MPFKHEIMINDFDCYSNKNLELIVKCYQDWIVIGSRESSDSEGWCSYSVLIESGSIKNMWIDGNSPVTKAIQYQWYKVCHVLFQ